MEPTKAIAIEDLLPILEVGLYLEIELGAGSVVRIEQTTVAITHPRLLRGIVSSVAVPQRVGEEVKQIQIGMAQYLFDTVARPGLHRAGAHHRPKLYVELGVQTEAQVKLYSASVPVQFTEELH